MSPEQLVALFSVIADLKLIIDRTSAERDALAAQVESLVNQMAAAPTST